MKPFVRHAITITATVAFTTVLAVGIFGSPSATAQPRPQPAPGSATGDVRPLSGSGAGVATDRPADPKAATPGSGEATATAGGAAAGGSGAGGPSAGGGPAGAAAGSAGSAADGSPAGAAAGSAAPGGDAGSAAAGGDAGSAAAGSAAGSAAGAAGGGEPPRKPTIYKVDCRTAKIGVIVKGTPSGFDLQCASQDASVCSLKKAFAVGTAARFELGADGVQPYPEDKTPDIANLRAPAGQTTCIQLDATGKFRFRATSKPVEGKLEVKTWYELLADRPIDEDGNFWMPRAVNVEADSTDQMFYAVLGLSIFFFFGITVAVVYFVVKYRHRPGHKPEPSAAHNDALEITWTVIPTIICVFLFYFGWRTYVKVVTPPAKAVEIDALAWRWSWQFTHANGVKDKDLHVPVGTPVRLVMTSKDVLHAFYAPAMRVKQDIIPRRYTYAWFFATKPGTYRLTCAEYCGTDHSQMGITEDGRRAVVVVHEPGKYEQYLADEYARSNQLPPAELGAKVFEKNCTSCHTTDGTIKVGPSFKGDFGTTVKMSDGTSVKMDENYIRESVLIPTAKTRAGFPAGTMPSFEGQLKEKEIEGVIAFIKSLAK
jgi:cytochrome c oxidase subunit 2